MIENAIPEDFQYEYGEENSNGLGQLPKDNDDLAYDGGPLPMKICYQQMKNLMKRPAMTYGHAGKEEQPGYMKLTFSASKNVHANSKILQLSNMLGSIKHLKGTSES